jgi:hypothetical protein
MMLKPLGRTLMVIGATLGVATGMAMGIHWSVTGLPWVLSLALAKLTLLGSGALMGAGAFVERLGRRKEQRQLNGESS